MRIEHLLAISVLGSALCAQTVVYSNSAPRANATIIAGSDVGAPSLRYWGGWATDGTRMFNLGGRGIDAAGNALSTYFNALDAYDPATNTWTNVSAEGAAGAPSTRFRMALAYDPAANRLVVFGGSPSPGVPLDDCFAFDLGTNTWTAIPNPVPGTTGPTARWDASMQYDPATGTLILFGGQTSNINAGRVNDTWLLSGSSWAQLAPAASPSARGLQAMTTRSAPYNDIVLIGGQDTAGVNLTDTWLWNGAAQTWVAVTPNNATVPVTWASGNGAVYDSVRQVVSIIGGPGTNAAPSNTTAAGGWSSEFDCVTNEWRAFGASTVSQSAADPVWGTLQRCCVAFVNGTTYFWAGQNPATVGDANLRFVKQYQAAPLASATAYGAGCTGPGGVLTLTAANAPWTGRTFSATCTNLGATSLALTALGTVQAALPLSLVLPQAGPGCLLLNDALLLDGPAAPIGGAVSIQVAIPFTASLAGLVFETQVAELEFDLAFNWVGLFTSNGLESVVGAL